MDGGPERGTGAGDAASLRRRARREELRRAQRRRRRTALGVIGLLVAGGAVAVARPWGHGAARSTAATAGSAQAGTAAAGRRIAARAGRPHAGPRGHRPPPAEVRGVHVTHYVAGDDSRMAVFYRSADQQAGLNALEVDVKDEAGVVGFDPHLPLARRVHAVEHLYDPRALARRAHRAGLYLIGRVVMFEDPILSRGAPELAIHRRGGGLWTNAAGLGWTNPYDRRVWQYGIDLGRAAGRAGFDEIQFDYVRFPTDGDIGSAVFPRRRAEPYAATIARFLRTATAALHPLGLRVSADMFGLAATRDLHIGQRPQMIRNVLDVVSPMAYPSHYGPGEYDIPDPNRAPYRLLRATLADWRRRLRGGRVRLRPWIQDFSLGGGSYGPAEVRAQIRAVRTMTHDGFLVWNAGVEYSRGVLIR